MISNLERKTAEYQRNRKDLEAAENVSTDDVWPWKYVLGRMKKSVMPERVTIRYALGKEVSVSHWSKDNDQKECQVEMQ